MEISVHVNYHGEGDVTVVVSYDVGGGWETHTIAQDASLEYAFLGAEAFYIEVPFGHDLITGVYEYEVRGSDGSTVTGSGSFSPQ